MLRPVYGPVWESHPKSMSHTMKKLKITELEAEKGDAKMTLVPCIMALTRVVNLDSIQIRDRLPRVASFIQNLNYGATYGDIAGAVTCGIVYAIIRPVAAGSFEVVAFADLVVCNDPLSRSFHNGFDEFRFGG